MYQFKKRIKSKCFQEQCLQQQNHYKHNDISLATNLKSQ